MPEVKYGGVVPQDALDFFNAKKLRPAFDYRDVWREEHAINFTVAKGVKLDILADIREGLRKALAEGKTFEQFRKELTPLLQAKGWWGKRDMIDPETGVVKTVQLGSPRRLRTIYDANMRSARAAGQWARIQRSKEALPYLLYELGPSLEHRKEHEGWAGTILPVDHAFWKTHFTPNGYGCKCRIRQVSDRERASLLQSGNYTDQAPPVEYVQWENKRTGLIEDVPKGIDPGWDTNPGWLREIGLDRSVVQKSLMLDQLADPGKLFLEPVRLEQFTVWAQAVRKTPAPEQMQAVGVLGAAELEHFVGVNKMLNETLIAVDGKLAAAVDERLIAALPQWLQNSTAILWDASTRKLYYLTQTASGWAQVVVQVNSKPTEPGWAEKLNRVASIKTISDSAASALLADAGNIRLK